VNVRQTSINLNLTRLDGTGRENEDNKSSTFRRLQYKNNFGLLGIESKEEGDEVNV
jgi:hypothetical protein